MKIGDYETAEFALREFIDKNKDHDLAGSVGGIKDMKGLPDALFVVDVNYEKINCLYI